MNKITPNSTLSRMDAIAHQKDLPLAQKLLAVASEQGASASEFEKACETAMDLVNEALRGAVITL